MPESFRSSPSEALCVQIRGVNQLWNFIRLRRVGLCGRLYKAERMVNFAFGAVTVTISIAGLTRAHGQRWIERPCFALLKLRA
jgi:hypothetical protein